MPNHVGRVLKILRQVSPDPTSCSRIRSSPSTAIRTAWRPGRPMITKVTCGVPSGSSVTRWARCPEVGAFAHVLAELQADFLPSPAIRPPGASPNRGVKPMVRAEVELDPPSGSGDPTLGHHLEMAREAESRLDCHLVRRRRLWRSCSDRVPTGGAIPQAEVEAVSGRSLTAGVNPSRFSSDHS